MNRAREKHREPATNQVSHQRLKAPLATPVILPPKHPGSGTQGHTYILFQREVETWAGVNKGDNLQG